MQTDLTLPQLAGDMTAARLSTWLKHEGDRVEAGEPVVEFETDKTNVELEAPASGILTGIRVTAGTDGVPVGAVLAIIVSAGADGEAPSTAATPSERTSESGAAAAVSPASAASEAGAIAGSASGRFGQTVLPADDGFLVEQPLTPGYDDRVHATPLAAKMARLSGIDLGALRPTRTDGRISKSDIEAVLQKPSRTQAHERLALPRSVDRPSANGAFRDIPLSAMRRTTAARLQEAKRTIPHFYLETACRVDSLLALRRDVNEELDDLKVSVTDFVVFAAARALVRVPQANAAWNDDSIRVFDDVDIAVAVNTPKGLIAPVIRRAHTKSLTTLARELKALAARAREGSLRPEDYAGGTFTISNLGMFAVTSILPILNPPQACILGVGSIQRLPIVVDDAITTGSMMTCTLAADHRAIDGAVGAELLTELRRLLEDPVVLALRA